MASLSCSLHITLAGLAHTGGDWAYQCLAPDMLSHFHELLAAKLITSDAVLASNVCSSFGESTVQFGDAAWNAIGGDGSGGAAAIVLRNGSELLGKSSSDYHHHSKFVQHNIVLASHRIRVQVLSQPCISYQRNPRSIPMLPSLTLPLTLARNASRRPSTSRE